MTDFPPGTLSRTAVLQVLRLFGVGAEEFDEGGGGDSATLVASYSGCFASLWRREIVENQHVVLVWDETPEDRAFTPVWTAPYVGALEWAVCAAVRFPTAKVTVIDARPPSSKHRGNDPLHLLYNSLDKSRLHWLRVTPASRFISECLESWSSVSPGPSVSPSLFVDQLRRFVTEARDGAERHAITNILGPIVLSGAVPAEQESLHSHALLSVFEAAGLLPTRGDRVPTALSPLSSEFIAGGSTDVCFVLVDDQARQGWRRWVDAATTALLPGSTVDELTPEGLLASLRAAAASAKSRGTADYRFEFSVRSPSSAGEQDEILLLDLRLFAGARLRERAFYREVLDLWNELSRQVPPGQRLAWTELSKREEQAIARWIDADSLDVDDYQVVLSLLPRLVALLDPSLPIIIFSSTGQIGVVRKLLAYGNIITEFEKPRFFGDTSPEVIENTEVRFGTAVERALILSQGRSYCRSLSRSPAVALTTGFPSEPCAGTEGEVHVEIYFDESGSVGRVLHAWEGEDSLFVVGGIALAFRSPADAGHLNDLLTASDLLWGYSEPVGTSAGVSTPRRSGARLEKEWRFGAPPIETLKRIAEVLRRANCQIFAFAMRVDPSSVPEPNPQLPALLQPSSIDTLYRVLLQDSLEVLLFEAELGGIAPASQPVARPLVLSVNFATRAAPTPPGEKRADLMKNFGIYFPGSGKQFVSIGRDDAYPIVAEVLARRTQALNGIKVERARAASLHDFNNPKPPEPEEYRPRQIHYLADWITRLAKEEDAGPAAAWFDAGFVQDWNPEVLELLAAGRAADNGDYIDALSRMARAEHQTPPGSRTSTNPPADRSVRRWVTARAGKWVQLLDGQDFLALCQRLREDACHAVTRKIRMRPALPSASPRSRAEGRQVYLGNLPPHAGMSALLMWMSAYTVTGLTIQERPDRASPQRMYRWALVDLESPEQAKEAVQDGRLKRRCTIKVSGR